MSAMLVSAPTSRAMARPIARFMRENPPIGVILKNKSRALGGTRRSVEEEWEELSNLEFASPSMSASRKKRKPQCSRHAGLA
jgi:hypothetical protein